MNFIDIAVADTDENAIFDMVKIVGVLRLQ